MSTDYASADALAACMAFVDMPEDKYVFECDAVVRVLDPGDGASDVKVTLQRSIGRTGSVHADRQTMQHIGIPYTEFKPEYQTFVFREDGGRAELAITNRRAPAYSFVLHFRKR